MSNKERLAILSVAAFVSGAAISAAFYAFNMKWGEGWSKAISFAVFAGMLWITWALTTRADQPPPSS